MGHWTAQLDTYLDGELSAREMSELDAHLRSCPACAADVLGRLQLKRGLQSAGKRYTAGLEFRQRIRSSIAMPAQRFVWRRWITVGAVAAALALGSVAISLRQERLAERQIFGEIADLHVAALASANPVDVVSSDRHTVKPWFQGKIPFTFNLPELQNSEFTLVGGRISYLGQSPGAELIYQIRKHQISVFIFQDRAFERGLSTDTGLQTQMGFNTEGWGVEGLRYFVIGDASGNDIRHLVDLLKEAARS